MFLNTLWQFPWIKTENVGSSLTGAKTANPVSSMAWPLATVQSSCALWPYNCKPGQFYGPFSDFRHTMSILYDPKLQTVADLWPLFGVGN